MKTVLKKLAGTFILIAATYNPSGWCYLSWIKAHPDLPASIVLLTGFVLCVCFVLLSKRSYGAVGKWGLFGLTVFFGFLLWVLNDFNLVNVLQPSVGAWALIIILSFIFGIASSWPDLRRMSLLGYPKSRQSSAEWLNFGDRGE